MISEQRNYAVLNTEQAKSITDQYLKKQQFDMHNFTFGLPEIFDRYHVWNVPVLYKKKVIGEIAVDAYSKNIDEKRSSGIGVLSGRRRKIDIGKSVSIERGRKKKQQYRISELNNMLIKGGRNLY